jgi:isoquinoline 1-oxidoreductase alpha subunit
MEVTITGQRRRIDVEPGMPLLWYLRDELDLKGAKYGCGIGICGSCTVLVDGAAVRACTVPVSAVAGKRITTIEGIATEKTLHPVQAAWLDAQVPQCGFCQPGIIMEVVALLSANPDPSDVQIDEAVTNICRCGTYPRIRPAVHAAAKALKKRSPGA